MKTPVDVPEGSRYFGCQSRVTTGTRDRLGQDLSGRGPRVHCFDPDATLIGKLRLPEVVSNLVFGGPSAIVSSSPRPRRSTPRFAALEAGSVFGSGGLTRAPRRLDTVQRLRRLDTMEFQSPRFAGDPVLLEILNDPDTGQKKLGPGSPPDSVRRLQQALFDLAWTLRIDPPFPDPSQFVIGIYGPVTTKTVLAYKTHYDIHFPPAAPTGVIDGFAGPNTLGQLDAHCVPFDTSVAAIEAKADDLRASGIDVALDMGPPSALPILGTQTTARHAFFDGSAGAIYHSALTGAYEVHGALFDKYVELEEQPEHSGLR